MLPPKPTRGSPEQQRLLKLWRKLGDDDKQHLLSYATFLAEHGGGSARAASKPVLAEPDDIPRPESETVIAAIRRLSQTYPMLEKDDLLHDTSNLMTAHVMQGRPAVEVIDELEVVFRRHYERVNSDQE